MIEHKKQTRTAGVSGVGIFADGKRIVSGSHDQTLRMWNTETGAAVNNLVILPNTVHCVSASNSGQKILIGVRSPSAGLLDNGVLKLLKGHSHAAWAVAVSKDGRFGFTG